MIPACPGGVAPGMCENLPRDLGMDTGR